MKNQSILFVFAFFVCNHLFAQLQINEINCVTNIQVNQENKTLFPKQMRSIQQKRNNNSAGMTSYNAVYDSDYKPTENQDVIYLKANFIFLTKPDGTGNFEENNPEHQQVIDDIIEKMNHKLVNLQNSGSPDCYEDNDFIRDTKIQVEVHKIWKVDPAWDFLETGFSPGNSVLFSKLYPPNSTYYYSYLDNDPTIPKGVNVVFANNGNIYEELVVNQHYDADDSGYIDQYDLDYYDIPLQSWAASQFPSTSDLLRSSRQFYPDKFNKYIWMKEVVTKVYDKPWSTVRNWFINVGSTTLPHEFGHSLGLYHNTCSGNIMNHSGSGSKHFFRPDDVGTMHRVALETNMKNFFIDDSYTNNILLGNVGDEFNDKNPDVIKKSEMVIYPSPFTDEFTVDISKSKSLLNQALQISDRMGRIVHQERVIQEITRIDLGYLENEVYYLSINNKNKVLIKN